MQPYADHSTTEFLVSWIALYVKISINKVTAMFYHSATYLNLCSRQSCHYFITTDMSMQENGK